MSVCGRGTRCLFLELCDSAGMHGMPWKPVATDRSLPSSNSQRSPDRLPGSKRASFSVLHAESVRAVSVLSMAFTQDQVRFSVVLLCLEDNSEGSCDARGSGIFPLSNTGESFLTVSIPCVSTSNSGIDPVSILLNVSVQNYRK